MVHCAREKTGILFQPMSKIPTDPDEILALCSDLSESLHDGLEAGSLEVRKYFDRLTQEKRRPIEINRPLANDIVRYHALQHLHSTRKVGAPYHIEDIPFNGLSCRFDWCHVKVYKGRDGEPPTAHNTKKNRDYYNHNRRMALQPRLRGIDWSGKPRPIEWERIAPTLDRAHFIYCWEVDDSYNITRVQLVAPIESGKYKQGVKLFWRRDVPHPILGIKGLPTVNDAQEVDDLPLYFEDAGEQGEDD